MNEEGCILTPEETLWAMFDGTDENGIVTVEQWFSAPADLYDDPTYAQFHFNWSREDCERVLADYRELRTVLTEIAASAVNGEIVPQNLTLTQYGVWYTYLRELKPKGFDLGLIDDIETRISTMIHNGFIEDDMKNGEPISEEDLRKYEETKYTDISMEEEALYDAYRMAQVKVAAKRLPCGAAPYYVVNGAYRLCSLMMKKAPDVLLEHEAAELIRAMAVHQFADSFLEILRPKKNDDYEEDNE